jgi:superfamily II DNA or RNA helicase|tara:strand:- start:2265 stop:3767 length:1503 start_codon:yes stop_codon:yes gene_type:complete
MDKLKVTKKNESFLHIETDPGIERELSDHFCFFVPGYKFMPAYKNRMWDGKIRLYDGRAKTLYCGLFKYLYEFAAARDYEVEVYSSAFGRPDTIEKVDTKLITDGLTLSAGGKKIEPRDYQLQALEHALSNKKSLLLSPTASGKSLIIYMAIRAFLDQSNRNVLLIVPTTSLVEQMYSDFSDYSQYDEWSAEENCHKIYSGKEKYNMTQRVIITTWQSIYKMQTPWFQDYGFVIGDEAHNFKAKSLTAILEKCVNAEYRMGTTGTLDGTQTHQLVLEGLFGPVHRVTSTKKLIDQGALSDLQVEVLLLKYQDEICREVVKKDYQAEMDFIVSYEPRNNFIANLALDLEGNSLVLFQYVGKHGKPLHTLIQEKLAQLPRERKLFYVSGETDVDTREQIRELTEKQNDAIIVASMGTFSTGINIRNLHNIIFASPSKSQIRVLQSIGRGLRKSENGQATKVYDIADDLHWKSKKNYTLQHAAERIKIYAKEKFTYKIYDVKI